MAIDITYELMDDFRRTLSTAFFGALRTERTNEWQRVARRMGSSSSRNEYPFLGELASMREWIGPRIARALESHRYAIVNRKFELTMTVLRDQILDDAGGAMSMYSDRARIFGDSVALHPDELVMGEGLAQGHLNLSYDEQNFFDDSHPVGDDVMSNDMGGSGPAWYLLDTSKPLKPLIYQVREEPQFQSLTDLSNLHVFMTHEFIFGAHCRDSVGYGLWQTAIKSEQALTEENFLLAQERMYTFTNDEGRNMRMRPNLLVVPRSLETTARKLIQQTMVPLTISSGDSVAVNNYLLNAVDIMVSDYLPIANVP